MRTEERKREIIDKAYIADDGTVFWNEEKCKKYEEFKKEEKERKKFAKGIKPFLTDFDACPINWDAGMFTDLNEYKWMKVQSKKGYEKLKEVLGDEYLTEPTMYPFWYCAEVEYGNDFIGQTDYNYDLQGLINDTKTFFENLGYEIEVKRKEN